MVIGMGWESREGGGGGRKRRDWCLYVNAHANADSVKPYAQKTVSFHL